MKQFFKMMFAATFGVFIAFALSAFICFTLFIAIIVNIGSDSNAPYVPKSDESVFKITLNGYVAEETDESSLAMLFNDNTSLSMKDMLASIRNAKEQNAIKGIYLDMGLFFTEIGRAHV